MMIKRNLRKNNLPILTAITTISIFLFAYFACLKISSYIKTQRLNHRLEESISSVTDDFSGDFSLFFRDLGDLGLSFSHNAERKYPAASLIKIPILAVSFFAIKEGIFSLGDEFIIEKKDVTGGSGILKKSKLPKKLTLKSILELMIARSDNTAANKMIGLLGIDYINNVFKKLGLKDTKLNRKIMDFAARKEGVENYISSRDLVYLLDMIYKKKLVSAKGSEIMLSFLKNQSINDRIPKYLPKDVVIAHKTGLEKSVVGDVGIVFSNYGDYILCVIVSDFSKYKEAKDFIAKASLGVYNTYKKVE